MLFSHSAAIKKRTPRAVVSLAVVAALTLAACSSTSDSESPSASPDASLDAFYGQEVTFASCEIPVGETTVDGECGRVEVPIDYDDPTAETAELAVFRVPARGDERIGSLLLNPGGPGSPGVGYAASSALAMAQDPVGERFDLVGFDPRGVGASTPTIDCFTDAQRDADASPASTITPSGARPLVELCAKSVGGVDVLAHMGTVEAARDLDVLREVLGDEQLTFAGVSYGTRLGAVYAQTFPQNVRALVLDSALDPFAGTFDRRVEQFTGIQSAFDDLAAFCVEQGDCPLGDDVAGATSRYQELVRPLQDEPVPTVQGRDLTFTAANDAVTAGLYSEASWPAVIKGLTQLRDGRGDLLRALRDILQGRANDGTYTSAQEAIVVYNCLDETRFSGDDRIELVQAMYAAAPIFDTGRPVVGGPDPCEGWPVEPTLEYPYATDIDGLPSLLTIAATGDPLTPYLGGARLADTLGSSLLTVEGDQHGAIMSGNACVDSTVGRYLIDGETPAADARCRL